MGQETFAFSIESWADQVDEEDARARKEMEEQLKKILGIFPLPREELASEIKMAQHLKHLLGINDEISSTSEEEI
jgi:hypothetical protein